MDHDLEALRRGASEQGIILSADQMDRFRIYLDELCEWNSRMNLTGLSSRGSMAVELFLDSLIPGPLLPEQGKMLDVGTGAGFPGLPLKIFNPNLHVHLLEASTKKVSFLRQVIRLLRLEGIEVIRGRVERDGDRLDPSGYHIVTARAVAGLNQTIEWCAPFMAPGGIFVGFLGRNGEEEIRETQGVRERWGLEPWKVTPYMLPGKGSGRISLLLRKKA